jgi:hypothetical protein
MCPLLSTNWVLISQKTTFFIVTAVKTSNLTFFFIVRSPVEFHTSSGVFLVFGTVELVGRERSVPGEFWMVVCGVSQAW